jgi:hypothetical protein
MKLRIEDIADLPLLYAKLEEAEVCKTLNDHFKVHGNWTGLSVGETTVLWLMEILSAKSHFLLGVETWAEKNLHLLRMLLRNDEFRAGPAGWLLNPLIRTQKKSWKGLSGRRL